MSQYGERIKALDSKIKQAAALQAEIRPEIDRMEREIKSQICQSFEQTFGHIQYTLSVSLNAGSATARWAPRIYLFNIRDHVWCSDNQWRTHGDFYHGEFTRPTEPPVDRDRLTTWLLDQTEQLGIPVEIVVQKVPGQRDPVRKIRDIKRRWPGAELLASGEILYRGWDCTDEYAVVRVKGKIRVLYGTGGHGGGFDHDVPASDRTGIGSFLNFMAVNDPAFDVEAMRALIHGT